MITDVTFTIVARDARTPVAKAFAVGIVGAHDYDHARALFEAEYHDYYCVLGIYEGDLSWEDANALYEKENSL